MNRIRSGSCGVSATVEASQGDLFHPSSVPGRSREMTLAITFAISLGHPTHLYIGPEHRNKEFIYHFYLVLCRNADRMKSLIEKKNVFQFCCCCFAMAVAENKNILFVDSRSLPHSLTGCMDTSWHVHPYISVLLDSHE